MQIKFEKVSYSPSHAGLDGLYPVEGLSFELDGPGITGILGASDSGNNTVLNLMSALLRPDSGRIYIDGVDINSKSYRRSHKKSPCAFVMPGSQRLLWEKSLEREFGLIFRNSGLSSEEKEACISYALETVGLDRKIAAKKAPAEYSRQDRYKLSLALSIATKPDVLLLDEPMAQLDARGREDLLALLEKLKIEGYHIMIATNDADFLAEHADTVLVMQEGRIIRSGRARDVFINYFDLIRNDIAVPTVKKAVQLLRERDVNMPSNVFEYEQFIDRLKIIMWRKQK